MMVANQGDIHLLPQEEFDAMMSGTGTPSSTKVVSLVTTILTPTSNLKAPSTKKTPSRKRETSSQVWDFKSCIVFMS